VVGGVLTWRRKEKRKEQRALGRANCGKGGQIGQQGKQPLSTVEKERHFDGRC